MRFIKQMDRDFLEMNGYLIIKEVFSLEEIMQVKEKCSYHCSINDFKKSPDGDILSLEGMGEFMLDQRFIDIAKDVLGEDVVYFGDSALHCKPNKRIFHKDSRADNVDPQKSEYPLYRMGIFLQDHSKHSGGIKFRKGSHKKVLLNKEFIKRYFKGTAKLTSFLNFGSIVNASSEIGDVIIWNLRTDHSGGAVIPKYFHSLAFPPYIDGVIPNWLKLKEHTIRMAIFTTIAAPSSTTDNYLMNKIRNKMYIKHWENCHFDANEMRALAKERGVTLDFRGIESVRKV